MWERAERHSRQSVWQMKRGTSLIQHRWGLLKGCVYGKTVDPSWEGALVLHTCASHGTTLPGWQRLQRPPWPPQSRLVAPMKLPAQPETLPAPQQIPHRAVILQHTNPGNTPCFLILHHLRFSLPLHSRENRINKQDHWGKVEKRSNSPWVISR